MGLKRIRGNGEQAEELVSRVSSGRMELFKLSQGGKNRIRGADSRRVGRSWVAVAPEMRGVVVESGDGERDARDEPSYSRKKEEREEPTKGSYEVFCRARKKEGCACGERGRKGTRKSG